MGKSGKRFNPIVTINFTYNLTTFLTLLQKAFFNIICTLLSHLQLLYNTNACYLK